MSGKSKRNEAWLLHQAQARQAAKAAVLARQTEKEAQQQQAKAMLQKLLTQTVTQQQRLARLAPVFADRCHRVYELSELYRAEWERAEGLQAENELLRRRLAEFEEPPVGTTPDELEPELAVIAPQNGEVVSAASPDSS